MLTSLEAVICCVCGCSLDDTAPHEMLGEKPAHLDCAATLVTPAPAKSDDARPAEQPKSIRRRGLE